MWVRLIEQYLNTDHIVSVRVMGRDSVDARCRIFFADGSNIELTERDATPLLEALAMAARKVESEGEIYPSE